MHSAESRRARRTGFTILELMLAVALSGIVVVTVALLLRQLEVTRMVLDRSAPRTDAETNGPRVLEALLLSTEVTTDSTRQFTGDRTSALVPAWCDTPGGWQERCEMLLALDQHGDSTSVLAGEGNANTRLLTLPRGRLFAYLAMGHDAVWLDRWGRGVLPPCAIALVSEQGDTTVFLIGDRS